MHDEGEEPYVEYLQPVYLILMSSLKVALQPSLPFSDKQLLTRVVHSFFLRFTSVSCYIQGSKIDQILRLFYLYFARMRVVHKFDKVKNDAVLSEEEVKGGEPVVGPPLDSSSSESSAGSDSSDEGESDHEEEKVPGP